MPRVPRHQSHPSAMRPGSVYHVTSRAVANTPLFETSHDNLTFLSQVAEQCRLRELLIHSFCLMTTHFHLQIEDRRGQLSQAMSIVKSLYARYYNSTRERGPRYGALWAERFHAEVIDSKRYFDTTAAYVQLNPVRTKHPMVDRPDLHPWSSCAMTVVEGMTPAGYFRQRAEHVGGVDAILDWMPKPSTKASAENRRRRFEILLSGKEFAVEAVLGERSRAEYLAHLLTKAGVATAEMDEVRRDTCNGPVAGSGQGDRAETGTSRSLPPAPATAAGDGIPRLLDVYRGQSKQSTVDRILATVANWQPVGGRKRRELRDAEIWTLWRFTGHPIRKIAKLVRVTTGEVDRAICRVRALRLKERAWWRSIWNAEWSLRWSLAAAPWRD